MKLKNQRHCADTQEQRARDGGAERALLKSGDAETAQRMVAQLGDESGEVECELRIASHVRYIKAAHKEQVIRRSCNECPRPHRFPLQV